MLFDIRLKGNNKPIYQSTVRTNKHTDPVWQIRWNTESESVEMSNDGLAHEAAHAMERIRAGHLESDVVTLDASLQTMRLLDDVRAQIGVVYPSEIYPSEMHPSQTHPSER